MNPRPPLLGEPLQFDVRLPLGSLFTIFGALLVLWGLISDSESARARSLGVNIDRDWGVVLLLFGISMLSLALRARRAEPRNPRTSGP